MGYGVLDLFCGAGGLSLGFQQAGFEIIRGIDFNKRAIETYNHNFGPGKGICADLLEYSTSDFIEANGLESKIDVIIGGPPCQGFSTANRWGDLENDNRNKLFLEYVKYVDLIRPKAVVIENVAQIITSRNGEVKKSIEELFKDRGYYVVNKVLCSNDYGVPQYRKRNFFVMLKTSNFNFESLIKQPTPNVYDALHDLYSFETNKSNEGVFQTNMPVDGTYQQYIRDSDTIYNHYVSYPSKETQEKMSYVKQGQNWEAIPPQLFKTVRTNRHSSAYRRLDEKKPSCTIDTGNAHSNYYHPLFNRIPTVREAARLQSFPDSFVFQGSKSDQYKQVGNAVPPLMAKALALGIKEALDREE